MARVVDLIEKNIILVKQFVKIGRMPLSIMTDYDIYIFYKSITHETAPMKKYDIVAKRFKISVSSVRNAIRDMEKSVVN